MKFLVGRFIGFDGYCANDFQALAIGAVIDLSPSEVNSGNLHWHPNRFSEIQLNYGGDDMQSYPLGDVSSLSLSTNFGDTAFQSGRFSGLSANYTGDDMQGYAIGTISALDRWMTSGDTAFSSGRFI